MSQPSIKRVTFKRNSSGYQFMDINQATWEIVGGCPQSRNLLSRACRLADRGQAIEYSDGTRYSKINAVVESIR